MYAGFVSETRSVTVRTRLNLRRGMPFRSAPLAGKAEAATQLAVTGIGRGEPVQGNDLWFAGPEDVYFWSGACVAQPGPAPDPAAVPAGAGLSVRRRADGTILPLDDAGLRRVFGAFPYTEAAGGRIRIDPAWVTTQITRVAIPELDGTGHGHVELHQKAVAAFTAAFRSVQDAGLTGLIRTCAGTFVPRHKGWDPARGLSSHSWGVAIDLNAEWNGYGRTPAPRGSLGSVVDLVPLFEAQGFAWGGYFSPPYEDGMHFELARTDL